MRSVKSHPRALAAACAVVFASAVVLLHSGAGASAQEMDSKARAARLRQDVARTLYAFDELTLDPTLVAKQVRARRALTLETSRGTLEVELEPHDVRAADWRGVSVGADGVTREVVRAPSRTYKGRVRGMDGASARFTIDEGRIEGLIVARDGLYFIESARNFSADAGEREFLFYSERDVRAESFGECGASLAERVGAGAARLEVGDWHAPEGVAPPEVFAPRPELELATEADFEYFQFFKNQNPTFTDAQASAAAIAEITGIVNQVDGIYESQVGVEVRIVHQRIWESDTDPYNLTAASPALAQFRSSYDASFAPAAPPQRDLAHMWTGKDFDGSTIGIASLNVVCNDPARSYGISQRFALSPQKVGLTAHEIGHNFSAEHPNQVVPAPSNCAADPFTGTPTIMNSSITASTTFCQYSRDQITNHVAARGSCLARLVQPGCTYSVAPALRRFGSDGGAGSFEVTTGAGCNWGTAEGAEWLTITSGEAGTGPGSAAYVVPANAGGPRSARAEIAGRTVEVTQAASPSCARTPHALGQTVGGELAAGDCRSGQPERPNAFVDLHTFNAQAGQRVRIEMSRTGAGNLDTYLYLFAPSGSLIGENDDIVSAQQTDSRLPVEGFLALPATGTYIIAATSYGENQTGTYTLSTFLDPPGPNSFSFSSPALSVSEGVGADGLGADGTGLRVVGVTRTGDTSQPASVEYATSGGTADPRRDYEQALGTLRFAAGETFKTFTVFVTDDVYDESAETVGLALSNPTGATLGATPSAVLTIDDDDAATGANPVRPASFNTRFFVRQHYLDFFNREPDAAGLAFWSNQINSCGADTGCLEARRINVSAAFFLSEEFQQTGYLVYLAYQSAFVTGERLPFRAFLADTHRIGRGVVIGQPGAAAVLEANKVAFFDEFVTRQPFLNALPETLSASLYVNTLANNAGASISQTERNALTHALSTGALTRAQVLRAVVEDSDFRALHFNRAFVLMQYFGYMRRNPPDPPELNLNFDGYNFWLQKLEDHGGNFVSAEMVKAFITSGEYFARFGP